jgi:hypothetical protein
VEDGEEEEDEEDEEPSDGAVVSLGEVESEEEAEEAGEKEEELHLNSGVLELYTDAEQAHLLAHGHLAEYFVVTPRAGTPDGPALTSLLPLLPTSGFPSKITLFTSNKLPRGFSFTFKGLGTLTLGHATPTNNATLDLEADEKVVQVATESKRVWKEETRLITFVQMRTDKGRSVGAGDAGYNGREVERRVFEAPRGGGLKGAYGAIGDAVDAVGFIWGRAE